MHKMAEATRLSHIIDSSYLQESQPQKTVCIVLAQIHNCFAEVMSRQTLARRNAEKSN